LFSGGNSTAIWRSNMHYYTSMERPVFAYANDA